MKLFHALSYLIRSPVIFFDKQLMLMLMIILLSILSMYRFFYDNDKEYFYDEDLSKVRDLPLYMMCTITIACVHSEDMKYQHFAKAIVEEMKHQYGGTSNASIIETLAHICSNHSERILFFGRIPERNQYLGRESTPEELAYLNSL